MRNIIISILLVLALTSCGRTLKEQVYGGGYTNNRAVNAQMVSDAYFVIHENSQIIPATESYLAGQGTLPAQFQDLNSKSGGDPHAIIKDALRIYKERQGE